jgi:Peptidase family M23
MAGDRWTFLMMRGEDSPVRQYSVSPQTLKIFGGAAVLVVATLLALTLELGFDASARLELERLRDRNGLLTGDLARLQGQVVGLEGSLDRLSGRDAELRLLAGLDPIDDEVFQVGVGGPGGATPAQRPLWTLDPVAGEATFALDYDLNALERRVQLLSTSMDEAGDSLAAHRELLLSMPSILPTAGYLSSRFSRSRNHPIHNRPLPHEGIDVAAPKGTPILAAAKGRVVRAGWINGYGQTVEIDHGFGFMTRYGHASKLLVRVGQEVARGDIIAQVGSTGLATSSNLHYEVRLNGQPQNPMNYVLPGIVP